MILIRADANAHIGMGHIMRCLSLADAFQSMSLEVMFVLADDSVSKLVCDRGYRVTVLNSVYNKMEEELDLWPNLLPDFIIVDSYFVTDRYLKVLGKRTKVVYIDDIAALPYPVDVLVNYNAYGTEIDYHRLYNKTVEPILLLGGSYAPLREMFQGIPKRVQRMDVKDVLFSTGGSDDQHVALKLLKFQPKNYIYHMLIGALNTDKEEIYELAKTQPNIIIHENVRDMKVLISSCDIAVSAAGSTLYEICACGVPLITYITADNQIYGAKAFERQGLGINCGDLRYYDKGMEKIVREVNFLASDYHRRVDMGVRMQEMIDGKGAERLASVLVNSLDKITINS